MYSRVYVEITNICNRSCSFCHGHKRQPRRMSREEFSRVLEQLEGKTQYIYYHLMGEPLTHPLLPEFLQMAASRGFKSVITTNGTLLGKCAKDLLASPIHKISVSLHSFEKEDDAAHRAYLTQVASFADAASTGGKLICLRLWNKGFDGGKNQTAEAVLRSALPGDWEENTRGYRIRDRLYLEWGDRFAWPDQDTPEIQDRVFCYGLKDHFGILCDGSVVPCCLDSDGVITLGNIFTQDAEEILSAPRAKAMVEGFRCRKATESLCRRCGYAQRFG